RARGRPPPQRSFHQLVGPVVRQSGQGQREIVLRFAPAAGGATQFTAHDQDPPFLASGHATQGKTVQLGQRRRCSARLQQGFDANRRRLCGQRSGGKTALVSLQQFEGPVCVAIAAQRADGVGQQV